MIPYIVWHVSMTCIGTFEFLSGRSARASWRWITGLNTLTTSGYLDKNDGTLWNKSVIYCQTGIPGSAFCIIKGKWIFMVLFLTLLTPKWQIFLWLFWVLSAVLRLCFFRKVFLKSDTAVALRRSPSLILWITLVSFINVYYEYFCKITGCFGIKTLLHVRRQCKLRFWI